MSNEVWHTRKVRPETQDPLVGPHKWDLGPQYDQVRPGIQDYLSGTQDSGPQNFQVGPGTRDP